MIEHLMSTGAVSGPYRRPGVLRRLWARLEPVPEVKDLGRVVAVVLSDSAAEVEDVVSFETRADAAEWLGDRHEQWAGGRIAIWEARTP